MNRTHRDARATWLGRFTRGRRPDRNPLRRASDLIETAMLAILVVAFAAAAPFVALQSSAWARASAHQTQLAQEAARHQVTAVLLKPAPMSAPGQGGAGSDAQALARWTTPDGKAVTGEVPAAAGTAAGTKVRVWVTHDGQPTDQPLADSQVAGRCWLAGIFSVLVLGILLMVAGVLGRRALDRRRIAAWDAEWRATGPHWTTRA